MASNFHSELPNDQIHNPKDFSECANSSVLTKSSSGVLDWNTSPYGTETTITCGEDVAGGLHNKTFYIYLNPVLKAECHFNVSGEAAVFVPTADFFQIEIDITANDTAISVAAEVKAELDRQTGPWAVLTTSVNGTGKVTFSGMTNAQDTIDGNTSFDFVNVKTYTGTTVLTSTAGELSWLPSSGGGGGGGAVLSYFGAGSVDTALTERFIPMSGGNVADFATNIDPMRAVIPLASTLGTVSVRVGQANVDAVVKIYKNASVEYTSASTTWSSAGDVQVFTVNTGSWAAGDTFSFSIHQSTSVDMNYVVATVTFNLAAAPAGTAISNVVEDTTPQLGGDLDVQGNEITTSTSNGNVTLNPNGTGVVEIKGDGTTNGTVGTLQLNCSNNSHGVKIASPPHSAGASYTLTLPVTDGNANQVLTTDGNGNLSFKTLPQRFSFSSEAVLSNNRYYYTSLRYGWNYVVWTGNDNDMVLQHGYATGAMVAVNDYTEVSVKGHAGSMYAGSAGDIEFTIWTATPPYGTNNVTCTQRATTTIDFDSATTDVFKPLSFGATGLTINEGDYVFFAVRDPDWSSRNDIFCGVTITLS